MALVRMRTWEGQVIDRILTQVHVTVDQMSPKTNLLLFTQFLRT